MKQVLSVQDLSCLGKCSLTVALPVLSAMGCTCTPLPTAVLSSHTAFPNPHIRSLTEDLEKIASHWQSVGATFDTISIGYLSDPAQAAAAEKVIDTFSAPVILDPAMGDHGKLYSGLGCDHVEAMKKLCPKAQVLLPNVTEAALLTDTPYEQAADLAYYRTLLHRLQAFGAKTVVLTGVSLDNDSTGFLGVDGNNEEFSYQTQKLTSCHGTGDLFTAVFTGAFALGKPLPDCARLAAGFVEKVLSGTPTTTPFGANFESQLPWLWNQI